MLHRTLHPKRPQVHHRTFPIITATYNTQAWEAWEVLPHTEPVPPRFTPAGQRAVYQFPGQFSPFPLRMGHIPHCMCPSQGSPTRKPRGNQGHCGVGARGYLHSQNHFLSIFRIPPVVAQAPIVSHVNLMSIQDLTVRTQLVPL